jgi:hypothetical protein
VGSLMSVSDTFVTRLTFVMRPMFECDTCGAEEIGETTTRVVDGRPASLMDATDAGRVIDDATQQVTDLGGYSLHPVGWSSYYSNRHHCPKCRGD